MPTLGNALDFAKYEGKNLRAHQLGTAPGSPVTGQLFYNTADNTLYWWDGTAWQSAKGGVSSIPDASTSVKGIVQLAGDLAGTATSPQIAAGVITDADVNAANKDGVVGTASMRTLGAGAQQAMPGNRTLDAITNPVAARAMNNQKITGLADGTAPTDAATKGQVDAAAQGLDAKQSVRAASTGNLGLSGSATVDGVVLANGDRVLVKDQTTPAQNGIYTATVPTGAWVRAADLDSADEFQSAFTWVEGGTVNADTGWVCTNDLSMNLGVTAVTWVQFASAGTQVAGAGLTKTGNTLDVGAGSGITVAADSVGITPDGITNAMLADGAVNLAGADVTGTLPVGKGGTNATSAAAARTALGAVGVYHSPTPAVTGTTHTITQATHGLAASQALLVQVATVAGAVEIPDVSIAANGDVTITWGASVTQFTRRVTIIG